MLAPLAAEQPKSASVNFELGLVLLKLGDCRATIVHLSRATQLEPNLVYGWRVLSDQLSLAGYGGAAEEAQAKLIWSQNRRSDLAEAISALAGGRLKDAETSLRAHLTHHTTDAFALFLLAEVGSRKHRFAAAESLLARAVALAPDLEGCARQLMRLSCFVRTSAAML